MVGLSEKSTAILLGVLGLILLVASLSQVAAVIALSAKNGGDAGRGISAHLVLRSVGLYLAALYAVYSLGNCESRENVWALAFILVIATCAVVSDSMLYCQAQRSTERSTYGLLMSEADKGHPLFALGLVNAFGVPIVGAILIGMAAKHYMASPFGDLAF